MPVHPGVGRGSDSRAQQQQLQKQQQFQATGQASYTLPYFAGASLEELRLTEQRLGMPLPWEVRPICGGPSELCYIKCVAFMAARLIAQKAVIV